MKKWKQRGFAFVLALSLLIEKVCPFLKIFSFFMVKVQKNTVFRVLLLLLCSN